MAELTAQDQKLPDEVIAAALLAYAQKRWLGVVSIDDAATSVMLDNEIREEAFNAALTVAYRAGRDAALNRDEWRITALWRGRPRRHLWSEHDKEEYARREYAIALGNEHGWDEPWIEHRRVGASGWKRVPDAE